MLARAHYRSLSPGGQFCARVDVGARRSNDEPRTATVTDGRMCGGRTPAMVASHAWPSIPTSTADRMSRSFTRTVRSVRRESDRDFNDQIDLVQEFDRTTQQIVRSVSDVDFDGVADLLVLFQDGQPVYSKWAQTIRALPRARCRLSPDTSRTAHQPLTSLSDPFRGDVAVNAFAFLAGRRLRGLPAPMGMPGVSTDVVGSRMLVLDRLRGSIRVIDSR